MDVGLGQNGLLPAKEFALAAPSVGDSVVVRVTAFNTSTQRLTLALTDDTDVDGPPGGVDDSSEPPPKRVCPNRE